MNKLIAVLDDELDMLEVVSHHLEKEGFNVKKIDDVDSFYVFIEEHIPDLIVLDIMLPGTSGFEICKDLKSDSKYSTIPIIMFSCKDEEIDKVVGLELGADDYITKPFSGNELVARVKAVLRRHSVHKDNKINNIGEKLTIDLEKYEVIHGNEKIDLTTTEFKILQLLSSRKGVVFSRGRILEHLWGSEKFVVDRAIDVHIRHLREKLGTASHYIKSVRGVGYKINE